VLDDPRQHRQRQPGRDGLVAAEELDQEPLEPVTQIAGVPFLQGIENSLRAVRSLNEYAGFLRALPEHGRGLASRQSVADKARASVSATGGKPLVERAAKDILRLYGIPVTNEMLATDPDMATSVARDIGYPVALKVESPDILHKTESGGIILNVANDAAASDGFRQIIARAREYDPSARLNGVLVQEMVPPGREMIVGMTQDPSFGPVVAVGIGGVFVEVLRDIALGVPPTRKPRAISWPWSTTRRRAPGSSRTWCSR
jgi:acetyltransferase